MFWLEEIENHLADRIDAGTVTHALMLAGPPGLGKRGLAARLAARFLGLPDPGPDGALPTSPDLHALRPEEGKAQISVDQVRALKETLSLSAHGRAGKVAVIEPADSMTTAAANSLLKTLEEPTPDSLLLLVVDGRGRLPATITSRTTVYRLRTPERGAAVDWLTASGVAADDAVDALALADGAPLQALALAEEGGLDIARRVHGDVAALLGGARKPVEVAGQWQKLPHEAVLAALRRVTIELVYGHMAPKLGAGSDFRRYVVDTRDAFCYLDALNRLIARLPGSYNPALAIEALAMPWARQLAGERERQSAA